MGRIVRVVSKMVSRVPNRKSLTGGVVVTLLLAIDMVVQHGFDFPILFLTVICGLPVAFFFLMFSNPVDEEKLNLGIVIAMPICAAMWPIILLAMIVGKPWREKEWVNRESTTPSRESEK